jgi:hypothetical protein
MVDPLKDRRESERNSKVMSRKTQNAEEAKQGNL